MAESDEAADHEAGLAEWWREDAARLDELADILREQGAVVPMPGREEAEAAAAVEADPDWPGGGGKGEDVRNAFNPDQPRGEDGRWEGDGGGGSDGSDGPHEQTPQEQFPHIAHLLNGIKKVHATGLTKEAAHAKVKELRTKGVFAGVVKDPKTGKRIVVNYGPAAGAAALSDATLDELLEEWPDDEDEEEDEEWR